MKPLKQSLILLLALPLTLLAGEPPTKPILRINTDMHTDVIKAVAVNAEETRFYTTSSDKTVKVWDRYTGQLLRTLRVPIANNAKEGQLYALALDPKEQWLAVAGWTVGDNDAVYILNPQNGKLLQRLGGLPNVINHLCVSAADFSAGRRFRPVINHLCVSADGKRLAATLFGKNGIRQWQRQGDSWQSYAKDSNYSGGSYGCAYTRDKRLLTSSEDGYLRLYNAQGKSPQKIKAKHGKDPTQIAIHSKQNTFAVGYYDKPAVSLGTLTPFKLTQAVNNQGLDNGNLLSIAWSTRGDSLYAGGMYQKNGIRPVVAWNKVGKGKPQLLAGNENTIFSIAPLKNNDILSVSGLPAWLIQNQHGKVLHQQLSSSSDFRDQDNHFLLSTDGKQVALGREQRGENPIHINLSTSAKTPVKALDNLPKTDKFWRSAHTDSLSIDGWKNTKEVQVNGKPVDLRQYETSRSLAIAGDKRSLLLGTEWRIRRYQVNNQGAKLLWEKAVPIAWGVNLTPDQRLAVAALGDGTIRWYRYRDGEELLALFIDKNTLEWVVWTPRGYYDASIHGDKLIGWHVNRGKDKKPDFFPASKFRKQFYRPRVIAHILDTLDIDNAIALAEKDGEKTNAKLRIEDALPPVDEAP